MYIATINLDNNSLEVYGDFFSLLITIKVLFTMNVILMINRYYFWIIEIYISYSKLV